MKKWSATSSLHFLQSALCLLVVYFAPAYLHAAPFTPASDDEVLISLPAGTGSSPIIIPASSGIHKDMTDAERIGRAENLLATAYEMANEDAFGQVEAVLAPWANNTNAATIPVNVQFMLAVVRQHNHEFSEALELLSFVLHEQPANGAALMQRAQINLVLGNYDAASQDCRHLLPLVSNAISANCIAQVAAVTGQAQQTYTQLKNIATYGAYFAPAEYVELMLTLATVAHRLGLVVEAESYYQLVLRQDNNNLYAILQFTDFLLEQQRNSEVLSLLEQIPAQLLTLELQVKQLEALQGSNVSLAYADRYQQLGDVFAVARARVENFPYKEYARFLLQTPEHAQEALQAALANWQYQKEPGDLLLLVRAATAARNEAELARARAWIATTGLEDQRITALLGSPNTQDSSTAGQEN